MRIVRYSRQGEVGFGILEGETVAAISPHPFGAFEYTGERLGTAEVRLLAPVLPTKVIAVGRNYAEHAAELGNEVPPEPVIFLKPSTSVIGPGDPIVRPVGVGQVELPACAGELGHAGLLARFQELRQLDHLAVQPILHPDPDTIDFAGLDHAQHPAVVAARLLAEAAGRDVVVHQLGHHSAAATGHCRPPVRELAADAFGVAGFHDTADPRVQRPSLHWHVLRCSGLVTRP